MSGKIPSPEQVVASMSISELQELLAELRLDPKPATAKRLQMLVRELESLESAIEVIGGQATMRRAA